MKVKLDENLPVRLVAILAGLGHEVDTVPSEKLTGKPDADVWSAVRTAGRFFITQDLDFSDLRQGRRRKRRSRCCLYACGARVQFATGPGG